MGILEGIGVIAIAIVCGYLLITYLNAQGEKDRERELFIKYSPKARKLYEQFHKKRRSTLERADYSKKLKEVMTDQDEKKVVQRKITEASRERKMKDEKHGLWNRIKNSYRLMLLEIWDTKRYMTKDQLYNELSTRLRLQRIELKELILNLEKFYFIEECPWDSKLWRPGMSLEEDSILSPSEEPSSENLDKVSREKWLAYYDKTLDPPSQEELNYEKERIEAREKLRRDSDIDTYGT